MALPPDGSLFDSNPVQIGGFEFRGRSAVPIEEQPTLGGWRAAFEWAESSEHGGPYWVADLLAYAETRIDWRAKMDQAKARTKLAHQTLLNRTNIGKKVKGRARELAPSISHAAVVAKLEPEEQEELLEAARAGEWTVAELKRARKKRERDTVVEGQAPSMHTIDITVRMVVEADNEVVAQDQGWALVKAAIKGIPHAHVIGSCSYLPAVPARKLRAVK